MGRNTLLATDRPGYGCPVTATPRDLPPTTDSTATPIGTTATPADAPPKPLLRGWSHGFAAGFAIALAWELWQRSGSGPRALSVAVFGIAMIWLYAVSATYHLVDWTPEQERRIQSLDHASIYVLIAGTYTPLCVNLLAGRERLLMLAAVWGCAIAGGLLSINTARRSSAMRAALYLGMGWIGIAAMPTLIGTMEAGAFATLIAGGLLYSIGAVVYATERPDPVPHVFGYHEVFHLLVISGSAAFVLLVWIWVLPLTRA